MYPSPLPRRINKPKYHPYTHMVEGHHNTSKEALGDAVNDVHEAYIRTQKPPNNKSLYTRLTKAKEKLIQTKNAYFKAKGWQSTSPSKSDPFENAIADLNSHSSTMLQLSSSQPRRKSPAEKAPTLQSHTVRPSHQASVGDGYQPLAPGETLFSRAQIATQPQYPRMNTSRGGYTPANQTRLPGNTK